MVLKSSTAEAAVLERERVGGYMAVVLVTCSVNCSHSNLNLIRMPLSAQCDYTKHCG